MVKIFSSVKRTFSFLFLACHWRRHSVLVCRISFKVRVRRCLFDCQNALMCRSSLMRRDIDRANTFSSRDKEFCFQSRFWRIRSCALLIAASVLTLLGYPDRAFLQPFLITFNCPIDKHSQNFQWFQEVKNLKIEFSTFVKGNHSHTVFLETPLHVNTVRDVSKLPWHKYLKVQ